MHLTICEHPIEIVSHGVKRKVPCGKCDYCRSIRNIGMAQRINLEMRSHKFGIFFTLTYAEINLPKFVYDMKYNGFYVPNCDHDLNRFGLHGCDDSGLFVSAPYISKGSRSVIDSYMNRLGFVPFLRKKDIQDFVKRVRIKIDRHKDLQNENKEDLQIIYAINGEYGPTTFKPHSHGLFLFDNEKLSKVLPQIIHEAWPYGSSRCRFTKYDEKSDYVAKYLNSIARFPNIYRIREFHPFLLVSKSHPLGLRSFSEEEVRKVATSGSYEIVRQDLRTGKNISVPLPPSIERRLFPKFTAIDYLDSRLRTRLLELSLRQTSLSEFINNVNYAINSHPGFISYPFTCSDLRFSLDYCEDIKKYFLIVAKDRGSDCRLSYDKAANSSITSLYYAGCRVRYLMHKYGFNSLSEYLDIYDKFQYNKAMFRLSQQMKLEEFVMTHDPAYLKFIDLDSFNSEVLESFEFKPVLDKIKFDISHSSKNRRKNEYIAKNPSLCPRFDNFSEGF